jgi:Spy/CpxP family protein refolding chaperone
MDNVPNSNQSHPQPNRMRRWALAGGLLAGLATAGAALGWHATAGAHGPRGHFGGSFDMSDPAAMSRRLDAMVGWVLADIDATQEQRDKIGAIAKAAAADLAPLRQQHIDARRQSIELLKQPTIDRAALEQLRAQQLQLGDTASRRMVQALADAAEVLTPDQRAKLIERWESRRHHRRRG